MRLSPIILKEFFMLAIKGNSFEITKTPNNNSELLLQSHVNIKCSSKICNSSLLQ